MFRNTSIRSDIQVYALIYKYKIRKTSISISQIYICPLGDLNTYTSDTSTSMCPVRDLNKHMFAISTNMCISCCMN